MATQIFDQPALRTVRSPSPWITGFGWALQFFYGALFVVQSVQGVKLDVGNDHLNLLFSNGTTLRGLLLFAAGFVAAYGYRKRKLRGLYFLAFLGSLPIIAIVLVFVTLAFTGDIDSINQHTIVQFFVVFSIAALHAGAIIAAIKNAEQLS